MADFIRDLFGILPASSTYKDVTTMEHEKKENTLNKLQDSIEFTRRRIQYIEHKIRHELSSAKTWNAKGDMNRAMECLKRKRLFENQCKIFETMMTKMEAQMFAIENNDTKKEVIDTMKEATSVMRSSFSSVDTNDIENVMDDFNETMSDIKEIDDVLSESMAPCGENDIDEKSLMDELISLAQETTEDEFTSMVSHVPSLPSTRVIATPIGEPIPSSTNMIETNDDYMTDIASEFGF